MKLLEMYVLIMTYVVLAAVGGAIWLFISCCVDEFLEKRGYKHEINQ